MDGTAPGWVFPVFWNSLSRDARLSAQNCWYAGTLTPAIVRTGSSPSWGLQTSPFHRPTLMWVLVTLIWFGPDLTRHSITHRTREFARLKSQRLHKNLPFLLTLKTRGLSLFECLETRRTQQEIMNFRCEMNRII
jgi:hypothetical protein